MTTPDIPEEIRERLEAAERVCVMYGWCPVADQGERGKALYMLWKRWVDVNGTDMLPASHPDLNDDVVADLARQYDEIRARVLQLVEVIPAPGSGTVDPRSDPSGAPPIGEA
jgi:hypothetical protein